MEYSNYNMLMWFPGSAWVGTQISPVSFTYHCLKTCAPETSWTTQCAARNFCCVCIVGIYDWTRSQQHGESGFVPTSKDTRWKRPVYLTIQVLKNHLHETQTLRKVRQGWSTLALGIGCSKALSRIGSHCKINPASLQECENFEPDFVRVLCAHESR